MPPLFEPLRVGNVTVNHRARAPVPGNLIIAEATVISAIQAWKKITDAVHGKGSYIFCQLVAPGRVADTGTLRKEGGFEVSAPIPIPMEDGAAGFGALTEEEIYDFMRDFAIAAKNAIAAGFEGVEVYGSNGYQVDQFLQDVRNWRTDQWGGSVENRARFGIEVSKALVEAVWCGTGFRISPWNTWQGMKMADPVPQFPYLVRQLKDLGLAYLHVIESRVINNVDCEKQEDIKTFLDTWGRKSPVLIAGGYKPENVLHAIQHEYKDHNIAHGIPLQEYDRNTFYTPMQCHGYADYPFSSEFQACLKN
ncbi:uncharacterized protein BDW43DRAFT_296697 [Aspergillus alliaceus]|uniref:uncharacterized protein n=1 Tax=Petromyces alliaceus TaxID=209559 RepID=UPI0012A4EA22|nr:uncharacterized protein BDW43DRAFT_296697 [Aspergillus alliaceus]KAB8238460.1 hypothetical protein BDW43DRAFT_296697 [Aspergillus alliaceus]